VPKRGLRECSAQELILEWIIDDGHGEAGRPHQQAILNPAYQFIGIASGPHSVGRCVAVIFTEEYEPNAGSRSSMPSLVSDDVEEPVEEFIPLPSPVGRIASPPVQHAYASPQSAHSPAAPRPASSAKPSGFVYPAYTVGGLQPIENGKANILPITNLACDVGELSIGLRMNGNKIEFKRSVTENGKGKTQSQAFNLPYAVTPSTCSAKYYPNRSNGDLQIRLGRQMQSGSSVEQEICSFSVFADPRSSQTRITIAVDQKPDYFKFSPGAPSKYNTDFTVVLHNNSLDFKSTYTFEEGDTVKTMNTKQTVELPFPPSLEQIDVEGCDVIVYPKRVPSENKNIPDCEIPISLGN